MFAVLFVLALVAVVLLARAPQADPPARRNR
jgi:hypothetical protein